jgi:hypothetical protein
MVSVRPRLRGRHVPQIRPQGLELLGQTQASRSHTTCVVSSSPATPRRANVRLPTHRCCTTRNGAWREPRLSTPWNPRDLSSRRSGRPTRVVVSRLPPAARGCRLARRKRARQPVLQPVDRGTSARRQAELVGDGGDVARLRPLDGRRSPRAVDSAAAARGGDAAPWLDRPHRGVRGARAGGWLGRAARPACLGHRPHDVGTRHLAPYAIATLASLAS